MTEKGTIAATGGGARWLRAALLVSAVLASAGAARADWLVLASGEEVETKGPWKVDGRMLIFTTTRGQLSSIRATSVDVEASRALTVKKHEEATRVVSPTPTPRREPVLRLTDADFSGAPATAPSAAGAATPAGGAPSEPVVVPASDSLETRVARQVPGPPSLQVMNWSVRPTEEDELSVLGYVQNVGNLVTARVALTVTLYDSEGTQVASVPAALSSTALMPGVQSFFEAKFPGAPNFATADFALTTVELAVGSTGEPEPGAPDGEEQPAPTESQPEGAGEPEGAGARDEGAAGDAAEESSGAASEESGDAAQDGDLPDAGVRQAPPVQRVVRRAS
jgi:hypothetical protein